MPQDNQENEKVDVMFGQNADYEMETGLEQRANQLTQNLLYFSNYNIKATPPNMRAEAEALASAMRRFLMKYPVNLDELDRLISQLRRDIYMTEDLSRAMSKISDQFAELAGKALKFRARTNIIPESEYHFLYKGYKSPPQQGTGST